MKLLYVTRHFNHNGYIILKKMVDEGIEISAILVKDEFSIFKVPFIRHIAILLYLVKTKFYNGDLLKTINSEEIYARKNGIKIIKTKSIKTDDCFQELNNLNLDLIVLGGGWHELIPERVFCLPKYGCINTHPSLLPEFRGTSITRWQVLHGIEYSGSTIHFVDDKFDTGEAIAQSKIKVDVNYTPQKLFKLLGESGAKLMVDLLKKHPDHFDPEIFHPENNSIYYKYYRKWKWEPERLSIDWNKSLKEIHSFIIANSQESYEYIGPSTKINGISYYVRQTRLKPKRNILIKNRLKISNDNRIVYTYIFNNKDLYLFRKNENWILHIVKVQPIKNSKLKRAFNPLKKIRFENNGIFNTEQI